MSVYTVQLNYPHATRPTICWRVWIRDLFVGPAHPSPERDALSGHQMYVPDLPTWSPETLRLALYELSAYLPAHFAAEALVHIEARSRPQSGRVPKRATARPRVFDDRVVLAIEARGWRAEVWTHLNDETGTEEYAPPYPGPFTEPMQAHLLELAARSPFPLSDLAPEYSAVWAVHGLKPSRLNLQRGVDVTEQEIKRKRVRRLIDLFNGDGQ